MTLRYHRRISGVKVISFDLDDTLYDNVPIMREAEANVQKFIEQEYPQTRHWDIDHWRQRRIALMQSDSRLSSNMTALRLATLQQGFTEAGVDQAEHAANQVMEQFHHHRSNFQVPDIAHAVLTDLKRRFRLCAISNGNVDCERIGIADYFDIVIQPQHNVRGKPHTDMFDQALTHYRIRPDQLLHIGDHPISDVLGAHRAGCHSGWFTGGLGAAHHLRVVPSFSFDKLDQLSQL